MKIKIALLLASLVSLAPTAFAEKPQIKKAQGLQIVDPWIQATTDQNALLFLKIANPSNKPDELIDVTTNSSVRSELQAPEVDNSVTYVKKVGFIMIPPKGNKLLEPGGNHIMLMQLNRHLAPGDSVEVTFKFKDAGNIQYLVPVRSR
jgi:copper(I)-binding protein